MLLLLSLAPAMITSGSAGQNQRNLEVDHYKTHETIQKDNLFKSSTMNDRRNFITTIIEQYKTQNPHELDEISDNAFSKGEFNTAADATIVAAIYGLSDGQALLAELDPESVRYITSTNPQSEDALRYYNTKLRGQVMQYFILQSRD